MPDYQVISPERHGSKRWHKLRDYHFTRQDHLVGLALPEVPAATMWYAMAFIPIEQHPMLVGIQGLEMGRNLMLAADGSWAADFVPSIYRPHPFRIITNERTDYFCVDESSGLVNDDIAGTPFFDADNKPSAALQDYIQRLAQFRSDLANTKRVCGILHEQGLLEPWPIQIEERPLAALAGLMRVNERKLNALEPQDLAALRDCGALSLAYCQLLSMQNLKHLVTLANRNMRPSPAPAFQFAASETISFSNLGQE